MNISDIPEPYLTVVKIVLCFNRFYFDKLLIYLISWY